MSTSTIDPVTALPASPGAGPLAPGPALRLPGSLRRAGAGNRGQAVPSWLRVALTVTLTVSLGTWGYLELHTKPRLSVLESIYAAVKLYTLDLGPGNGASPGPDWQLWVALVLAAGLLARGVLALLRDRVARFTTRHVLRGHVVICGAGVYGTRLAETLGAHHDVVLVDLDPESLGLRTARAPHLWRAAGDGVAASTLITAGIARAHWVVAVTGADFVNSQIVSAVRALAAAGQVRDGLHVLVQVEDPSLARFLEEGEGERAPARTVVSPFSADAIAAETLLEESAVRTSSPEGSGPLMAMRDGAGPNLLLAGDHPLIDALVLASLRRWRVRTLRELEAGSGRTRPPMHVSVYGPDAERRVARLRARWRPEPAVLALEARDSPPVGEESAEAAAWLRRPARADHAIVVCASELDGIGLTLTVARALGGDGSVTRVTTQLESALDAHLEQRTAVSPELAGTEVKSVAELGARPERMERLSEVERLTAALRSAHDSGAASAPARAAALLARPELAVVSDSGWRIRPSERPLLEALLDAGPSPGGGSAPLPPVPLSAVIRAGLRVELDSAANLRAAAERLSTRADPAALGAWCEYMHRLGERPAAEQLAALHQPALDPDAERILRLRRAVLGERDAISAGPEPRTGPEPLDPTAPVVILAGAAGSMSGAAQRALEGLLEPALSGYPGTVLSGGTTVGMPGIAARIARRQGLALIGYVPVGQGDRALYPVLRETPDSSDFSVREPLAMWTEILTAGVPVPPVCVIACPGGKITVQEILLARALGARVAFVDPAGDADEALEDALPLGGAGVLELPADPMTVRAFLRPARVPDELRERAARHLHREYRRRHRSRKDAGDPGLAPWEELLPALKLSNLAQADDIPNKLGLIGKRLASGGERLELAREQIELLAEVEHGRWNVERLSDGWRSGARQADHRTTPNLKPWSELEDGIRDYDREAVADLPAALADTGWGVSDV